MLHSPLPAFTAIAGPRQAKILLLGEAWGESEAELRQPFAGESGKELWRMLGEAFPDISPDEHARVSALHRYGLKWVQEREPWLAAASIAMTNVLAFRPPNNNLELLCDKKDLVGGNGYLLPPLTKGKYLRPEFLPELDRLRVEIEAIGPNLIIALGNTATWAVLRATNIGSIRGAVASGAPGGPAAGIKCLPTYHPAGVLRMWAWRPIVVTDLLKGKREGEFPEIRRPRRQVLVNPTISEIQTWACRVLENPSELLSCDIETGAGMIKCIGFGESADSALVIPFIDPSKSGWSYWENAYDESRAWAVVEDLLASSIPKLFQNGLYDLQYLCKMGLCPKALLHDSMLLHHSLFPELQKGLGFLGSIYTSEASWKLMRREKVDTEKRDE